MFQEHIDKVLEFKTPVCLDDIICVTNGMIEEHQQKLREVLSKLQEAGYRANEKKKQNYSKQTNVVGIPDKPKRGNANSRLNRSNNEIKSSHKHQRTNIILGLDTTFVEVSEQPIQNDRYDEKITEKRRKMGIDKRNK